MVILYSIYGYIYGYIPIWFKNLKQKRSMPNFLFRPEKCFVDHAQYLAVLSVRTYHSEVTEN